MKSFAVLSLLLALFIGVSAADRTHQFHDWMRKYGRSYSSIAEYQRRLNVFKSNMDLIEAHNQRKLSWSMAPNAYADLEWSEFRDKMIGSRGNYKPRDLRRHNVVEQLKESLAPESTDWTKKGAVTRVGGQGHCESGW